MILSYQPQNKPSKNTAHKYKFVGFLVDSNEICMYKTFQVESFACLNELFSLTIINALVWFFFSHQLSKVNFSTIWPLALWWSSEH